jgi:CO/xanthine dehydrogenase Mo-binding subunit
VTPDHARYAEQCTFPARHLYATENLFVGQQIVQLDVVPNTWMRAPGESIGTFALESALDELSYALGMDPIDVRRLNEPSDVPLQLPTPRDPRARRPAESCAARLMARCRSRRSRATPARAAARWSGSFSPRPG